MNHTSELDTLVAALRSSLPRREVLKRAAAFGIGASSIAGAIATDSGVARAAARAALIAQEPVSGGELGIGIPIDRLAMTQSSSGWCLTHLSIEQTRVNSFRTSRQAGKPARMV